MRPAPLLRIGEAVLIVAAFAIVGCSGSSRLASSVPDESRAILIAYDGEVLAELGDCAEERARLAAIRGIVAEEMRSPQFATSEDGRALVVTEDVGQSPYPLTPPRPPITYAWPDWREPNRYVRLESMKAQGDFVTSAFVLVGPAEHPRERWLVSLADPSLRYQLPRGVRSCDVLADGRWVGLTREEVLVGALEGDGVRIDVRVPFAVSEFSYGDSVRWCPGGESVFVQGYPPGDAEGQRGHRVTEVLLLDGEPRFAAQVPELREGERFPVLVSVRREGPRAATTTRVLGLGSGSGWRIFELVGGELRQTDQRASVPGLWGPEVPSPDGRSAIVCREDSTGIWIPGGAPEFAVFRLTPESSVGRYRFPFYAIGGWLACGRER